MPRHKARQIVKPSPAGFGLAIDGKNNKNKRAKGKKMKYKTTDREQRQNNALILGFAYCQIQNIERYLTPRAYTAGIYGWRADFYEFPGFTISTGYAPLEYIFKEIHSKKTAEAIKAEILKLEKKLEARAYAFQKCGDWDKGRAIITKKINSIYKKAIEAEYKQKNSND